jgi:hypothetical protein
MPAKSKRKGMSKSAKIALGVAGGLAAGGLVSTLGGTLAGAHLLAQATKRSPAGDATRSMISKMMFKD